MLLPIPHGLLDSRNEGSPVPVAQPSSNKSGGVSYPLIFLKGQRIWWPPNEDQRLFNSYGKVDKETLLMLFPDRTYQAIQTRANVLQIPLLLPRYTKKDDDLLLSLRDDGVPYKEIKPLFDGRTVEGLKKRVERVKKLRKMEEPR